MSEPKPLAALSGHLLARKGAARPAMRPQMQPLNRPETPGNDHLEDLGWNDMGEPEEGARHGADILPLTPAPKSVELEAAAEAEDREAAAQLAQNARMIAQGEPTAPRTKPEVVRQREEIVARLEQPEPAETIAIETEAPKKAKRPATARRPKPDDRRAAFTLRLDGDRHLKLRLACTIRNRSAQQVVTEALDRLLDEMPELEALFSQVKRH